MVYLKGIKMVIKIITAILVLVVNLVSFDLSKHNGINYRQCGVVEVINTHGLIHKVTVKSDVRGNYVIMAYDSNVPLTSGCKYVSYVVKKTTGTLLLTGVKYLNIGRGKHECGNCID